MCVSTQPLRLIVACALLCPSLLLSGTHSTPIAARRGRQATPCPHDSIATLIKKSPVILKALGAHIFTEDAQTFNSHSSGAVNDELKWQNVQNNFLAPGTLHSATGPTAADIARHRQQHRVLQLHQKQQPLSTAERRRSNTGDDTPSSSAPETSAPSLSATAANSAKSLDDSIFITLTPETIYKGASLLKMTPGTENAARSSGAGSSGRGDSSGTEHNGGYGNGSGGSATPESAYQYEGSQLNATLQPLSCFDVNLLKILPTELIIFGKLITGQQQQQQQQQQQFSGELHATQQMDFLSININGLHRWSPQFENHIWKHLGWDDWSDFTLCSVTCGKGVQQRFRRCLLDNPMVNFNMQLNLNVVADDEDDEDVVADNISSSEGFDGTPLSYNASGSFNGMDLVGKNKQRQQNTISKENGDNLQQLNGNAVNTETSAVLETLTGFETVAGTAAAGAAAALNEDVDYKINKPHKSNLRKTLAMRTAATTVAIVGKTAKTNKVDGQVDDTKSENGIVNDELMRTFEGNLRVNEETFFGSESSRRLDDGESIIGNGNHENSKIQSRRHHKRRKPTKNYSTMFCEGYNIEQRNCNTFECSDDISDLLKFYKKFALPEDVASPATVAMQSSPLLPFAADSHTATTAQTMDSVMPGTAMTTSSAGAAVTVDLAGNATTTGATSATGSSRGSGSDTTSSASIRIVNVAGTVSGVGSSLIVGTANANAAASTATVANAPLSTTPANMGYIRYWRNPLNFTIMLTLRVRNDSKTAITIFSIRNATHNLYLEACKDGLRLYLERDSTTEMLPLKFNLYDYRWHQVAISIQNGDFISIYVDCSWTNSFVVSKRLYTLPLNADVEIGRGFNGELQQLLVLPDNQERQQCSNRRTSINEVKRYIIDTFIDDYGN